MDDHFTADPVDSSTTDAPRHTELGPPDWPQELPAGRLPRRDADGPPDAISIVCTLRNLLIVGVLVYGAFQVYAVLRPGVPGCADGAAIAAGGLAPAVLANPREIGYAAALHQRGCSAALTLARQTRAYAYVIGLAPGGKGALSVTSAHPDIIQARFAHVGADGKFARNAEPLGRAAITTAMRAAIDAMRGTGATDVARATAYRDPDHEIADLEPLGACRALQAGARYACPLLIEHAGLASRVLGLPPELVKGEFTFVRAAGAGEWRVSERFAGELAAALSTARQARPGT